MRPIRLPQLKLHHQSGHYRALFNREYEYFGKEPEAAEKRFRVRLAEFIARGEEAPRRLIAGLIVRILAWAKERYQADTRGNGEARNFKYALRWLDCSVTVELPDRPKMSVYLLELPSDDFTACHLAAVQARMIAAKKSRGYINGCVRRIVTAFEQARVLGLVRAETVADLRSVKAVPAGHKGLAKRQYKPKPTEKDFRAMLAAMSGQMRDIVEVLYEAKARIGEVVPMRLGRLRTEGEDVPPGLWIYDLGFNHKSANATGKPKLLNLNKRCQEILAPYIVRAKATNAVDAPLWPALSRNNHGDHVTIGAVRDAVVAACIKAGRPVFTTHKVRHRRATAIVEQKAIELVQQEMQHDSASSSRLYADTESVRIAMAQQSG